MGALREVDRVHSIKSETNGSNEGDSSASGTTNRGDGVIERKGLVDILCSDTVSNLSISMRINVSDGGSDERRMGVDRSGPEIISAVRIVSESRAGTMQLEAIKRIVETTKEEAISNEGAASSITSKVREDGSRPSNEMEGHATVECRLSSCIKTRRAKQRRIFSSSDRPILIELSLELNVMNISNNSSSFHRDATTLTLSRNEAIITGITRKRVAQCILDAVSSLLKHFQSRRTSQLNITISTLIRQSMLVTHQRSPKRGFVNRVRAERSVIVMSIMSTTSEEILTKTRNNRA